MVVLSNALGTTTDMWDEQVRVLARRFRVLRYDHLPRATVADLAGDVLKFTEEQGVRRFSLCGLSLGAMVGMWLGANAAARVDKLVLACTSARFGSPTEWEERAVLVRQQGMAEIAKAALDKWFTPAFRDRGAYLQMQLQTPSEDYAMGLEAIGHFDFRNELEQISAPTLVIAGAEDDATPLSDAGLIALRVPDARLVVIEGAAHLANVERPGAFNAAVMEHLDA
jgi:3-oxoadipate enol-lactonase